MPNPKQQPNLAFEELEGLDEVVVIDHDASRCVSLNLTAAAVLELCDGSRDPAAIADELAAAFSGVEPDRIHSDVATILQQLREHNLLTQ